MWLAWEIAAAVAAICLIGFLWLRRMDTPAAKFARPFLRELVTMFTLYSLWQLAGRISVIDQAGAFRRAQQLWDLERLLLFPNEVTMQEWLLRYSWLIQASNIYYGAVHAPAMIACLFWLFLRDRRFYGVTRNNLTMFTGASLLIQLVAVAPPRFLQDLGFVDTAVLHNQSVFSSLGYEVAGQLQAMPSIHAGWAFLVGVATWKVATDWKRWIGPIHGAVTLFVIVITANHYWADGVVAGAVLAGSMLAQRVVRQWRDGRTSMADGDEPPPAADLVGIVGGSSYCCDSEASASPQDHRGPGPSR